MNTRNNQRGQYGGGRRPAVNLGIISVGVIAGLAAWPMVKKKRDPLGLIIMGASGSMVAVGATELLFSRL